MIKWKRIILLLSILGIFGCSFQKRLYRKGYYVEWISKKNHSQHSEKPLSIIEQQNNIQPLQSKLYNEDLSLLVSQEKSINNNPKQNLFRKNKIPTDTCGDVLILKTGDEYIVKVIEINDNEIKYKRCDNINGPTYTISKSKIYMIKYANGVSEHIESTEPDKGIKQQPTTTNTTDKKNKTYPPGYTLSWILFALSLIPSFFTSLSIYFLMFTARNAKRKIKEHPDLYKGLGEMNFLMYFSFIIASLIAVSLLLIGIFVLSNPVAFGLTAGGASSVGTLLLIIGVVVALPVIAFLITSNKDDFS
ncbi:MAG: hypothetical protein AB1304_09760 [Bacteroidota bacterium]